VGSDTDFGPPRSRTRGGAHLRQWAEKRNKRYLVRRAGSLLARYGAGDRRSMKRIAAFVDRMAAYDCLPTFAVPGRVVERCPAFFTALASRGAEIAIHGYDHVDLRDLSQYEVRQQFERAAGALQRLGISFDGFRSPYLGWSEDLAATLPEGMFTYSSNRAVDWNVLPGKATDSAVFALLSRFYRGDDAHRSLALPTTSGALVEIPASLPDDLQLLDGLGMDTPAVSRVWGGILSRAHARGELFAPLFHPESLDKSGPALEKIVQAARGLDPPVWVARLRDIASWWIERRNFTVDVVHNGGRVQLDLRGSERVTVLIRDWPDDLRTRSWDGAYRTLDVRTISLGEEWPFLGAPDLPSSTIRFLQEQGYLVKRGEDAARCSIVLRDADLHGLDEVAILNHIEARKGPLIRISRWPRRAKSALSLAGDLDALGLRDYATRLLNRW
jgi:peptidoglycan/xylan/chitin deacetylase (PgdA/CDA1 family)